MKNEKLTLINDNISVLDVLEDVLQGDHVIVARISTLVDFNKKLKDGFLEATTVAIVDDAMPREGQGENVARKLRETYPGIKIVSYSSRPQDWGDINLINSPATSIAKIREAILSL